MASWKRTQVLSQLALADSPVREYFSRRRVAKAEDSRVGSEAICSASSILDWSFLALAGGSGAGAGGGGDGCGCAASNIMAIANGLPPPLELAPHERLAFGAIVMYGVSVVE